MTQHVDGQWLRALVVLNHSVLDAHWLYTNSQIKNDIMKYYFYTVKLYIMKIRWLSLTSQLMLQQLNADFLCFLIHAD